MLAATLLSGFAVWCLSTPSIAGQLLGEGAYVRAYSHPLLSFFGLPSLALVSLAAGFAFPRGFWLWGFSANLLPRVADVLLPFYLDRRLENFREQAGAPGDNLWFSLAFATLSFAVFGVACTAASSLGAGLMLAARRLIGGTGTSPREAPPVEDQEPARARVGRALSRVGWAAVILGACVAFLLDAVAGAVSSALFFGAYPWAPPNAEAVLQALEAPSTPMLPVSVGALARFAALLVGGYVAGRLSVRARTAPAVSPPLGGVHGLLVAVAYPLLLLAFGIVARLVFGAAPTVDPTSLGLDPAEVNPANPFAIVVGLLIAALLYLTLTFLGGYLGGRMGRSARPRRAATS